MQASKLQITYHAQPQFDRLTKAEKVELERLVTNPRLPSAELAPSGNFVSRLGATKRVVWSISDRKLPIILSVVEADAA